MDDPGGRWTGSSGPFQGRGRGTFEVFPLLPLGAADYCILAGRQDAPHDAPLLSLPPPLAPVPSALLPALAALRSKTHNPCEGPHAVRTQSQRTHARARRGTRARAAAAPPPHALPARGAARAAAPLRVDATARPSGRPASCGGRRPQDPIAAAARLPPCGPSGASVTAHARRWMPCNARRRPGAGADRPAPTKKPHRAESCTQGRGRVACQAACPVACPPARRSPMP